MLFASKFTFSIIIPVYNAEQYLPQALASTEEYLQNGAEVIAVDNMSSDDSWKILCDFSVKHPACVKVFQHAGGMAGGARNKGLQHAEGDYVFFMDADDMLAPGALHALYQTALQEQADIAIGQFLSFKQNPPEFISDKTPKETVKIWDRKKFSLAEFFQLSQSYNVPWNKFIRRKILTQHQLAFPEGMPHEDLPFISTVFVCARRMILYPGVTYLYRLTPNSLSKRDPEKKLIYFMQSFSVMRDKLTGLGCYAPLQEEYEYYLLQMIIGNEGPGNGNLKLLTIAQLRSFLKYAAAFYLALPKGLFNKRSWLFRWRFFAFRLALRWQSPAVVKTAKYITDILGLFAHKQAR